MISVVLLNADIQFYIPTTFCCGNSKEISLKRRNNRWENNVMVRIGINLLKIRSIYYCWNGLLHSYMKVFNPALKLESIARRGNDSRHALFMLSLSQMIFLSCYFREPRDEITN
jgi:hypothetical protein